MASRLGRVLVIAGSDSGGGAGIQGDIKTITALSGYAATAITALTAQNTQGVFGVHPVPIAFVRQQIALVLEDIGADAIKTGMLHSAEVMECVADTIGPYLRHAPLVLDPVMYAKGGSALITANAIDTLKHRLLPLARIVTPNIPEAEHLCGMRIETLEDMQRAAQKLLSLGCQAVLLKGGHLDGGTVTDVLAWHDGEELFSSKRIHTIHTHGTGCSLASAIATGLAQGIDLPDAVKRARAYVHKAIIMAPQIGKGHGPLGHTHTVKTFPVPK